METSEYIYLADKDLSLFGMAPAVWLLVQLHELGILPFYVLPSKTAGNSPVGQGSPGSSQNSSHSPTAVTNFLQSLGRKDLTGSKSLGMHDASCDKGGIAEDQQGMAEAEQLLASNVVVLSGLSVDIAIVVVLSWAAQLLELEQACVVIIQASSITFKLGKWFRF